MPDNAHPLSELKSSNLAGYTYDADAKQLTLSFRSGGVWIYYGVPPELADGLSIAKSPGSFFHENIKSAFTALKAER